MIKIKDIILAIENYAPPVYQESYDNAGLIVGDKNSYISSVLLSIDVTEEIIDEAIEKQANLIICHHPIIFKGLKRLTPDNYVQRTVIKAIQNNIAIYAAHTNIDSVYNGVNMELATAIGLKNIKLLQPVSGKLKKMYCYIPVSHVASFREAIFAIGAGVIGNYDSCSFNTEGYGTFRAGHGTNPYVGNLGELHKEQEIKIETVFPLHLKNAVISTIKEHHPYEEPAYDIISLENEWTQLGIGSIGEFEKPLSETDFLNLIKNKLKTPYVKYTKGNSKEIKKVAVCGGSGSFLIKTALKAKADVLLTGDVKYHEFFDAENQMMIVDAGHYETEQFTKELFYRVITKKFPNFAVQFSNRNTNPVNYY